MGIFGCQYLMTDHYGPLPNNYLILMTKNRTYIFKFIFLAANSYRYTSTNKPTWNTDWYYEPEWNDHITGNMAENTLIMRFY